MKKRFPVKLLVSSMAACLPLSALAITDAEVEQLRQQVRDLAQRYEAQSAALRSMSTRLQKMEETAQPRPRPANTAEAAPGNEPSSEAARSQGTPGGERVVKEAPPTRSAEAVYQEQGAIFDRKFTLETGLTYTHSDRRDLFLNGFLALDAIFLGQLNLDRIKADTWTFDVTGRYAPTDRLQFDLNLPFLYRSSNFSSVGAGFSSSAVSERNASNYNVGDINAGVFYRLIQETDSLPDTILNLRIKAPSGKHPYGIKFTDADPAGNLKVPDHLPTGNGVWSVSAGASFIKTVDPAILFANVGYTHNLQRDFEDISSDPATRTPGRIALGDQYSLGGGIAFALNERMSLSTSYSHRFSRKARIRGPNQSWQTISGSDSSGGVLNFGLTYALSNKRSVNFNVGLGVTADSPDITIGVKFPFSF